MNSFEKMQKLAFGKVITETEKDILTEGTFKDKIKELVHKTLDEAKKKKKDAEEVGKLVTSNIEFETLKKDQAARNRKFYVTCTVILAIVAAAFYFMPAGASKGLLSIFKK